MTKTKSSAAAEKDKNKKIIGAVTAVVIVGVGVVAYTQGWIPGVGAGNKAAKELKAQVESMQGTGIEAKIKQYFATPNAFTKYMGAEELAQMNSQLNKTLDEEMDLNFSYSGIDTKSGEGKGTVVITSPKLAFSRITEGQGGEITAPKLIVSREADNDKHYFFHTEGDLEVYMNMGGSLTKVLAISADESANEFKLNDQNQFEYSKMSSKNLKFIEGRGNTVLATIEDATSESSFKTLEDGKIDIWAKANYKNINPGDMIRLMVGNIEPINVKLDYAYKGTDFFRQLDTAMNANRRAIEKGMEDVRKAAADPNYKPEPLTAPEEVAVEGDLKLSEFSIKMGDAGFESKADLKFVKDSKENIPTGEVVASITQYQKLIDYFSKFYPVPKEDIEKNIKFLSEIGENKNGNITVTIKLDGTENILINGKTKEEVEAIQKKYFPGFEAGTAEGVPPIGDGMSPEMKTPAAPVEVKPATPVKPAEAKPAMPAAPAAQ